MLAARPSSPRLRRFVRLLWAGEATAAGPHVAAREHVLPTGCMHLALRLSGPPVRVFASADDRTGDVYGQAVVGGARAGFYAREADGGWTAGALLEPGAARALFGAGAHELAECHTALDDLWGRGAPSCLERLHAARAPAEAVAQLEALLLERLAPDAGLPPGIAAALAILRAGGRVEEAVRASGFSHRHLVACVRDATGLAPKPYARVLRLQSALARLGRPGATLAGVALAAGYADQAHFSREFRDFAGVTPTAWLQAHPRHPHHVPMAA